MAVTIARPRMPRTPSPVAASTARRDIQGLRALAVIVVILNHLTGWPGGGYVGVDIFFVISGFLITGLLLREYEQTGRISFRRFYIRRARRILPAATLVLLATLVGAFFVFNRTRFLATIWDAASSATFAANWRFAVTGTNYFQADGPVSPLRHFWSLAVEEQFYLVWPWLMLGLLAIFVRPTSGSRTTRVTAGLGVLVILTGSYVWSLHQTVTSPTVAYFSTFSRAWELAIGAALAVGASICTRIPNAVRPLLAWTGLIGMVVSVFVVSENAGFPAPGAVLPTASAALLLAAGTGGGDQRWLAPLTNPVANYLGDISYSLYLWHLPVIILVGSVVEIDGLVVPTAVGAAILLLSVYSYHLVEDPIRRRRFNFRERTTERKPELPPGYRYVALSLLIVLCLSLCVAALRPRSAPVAVPYLPTSSTAPADTSKVDATYGPEVTQLQKQIRTSLTKTSWPKLVPSMDDAMASKAPADELECGQISALDVPSCTFGNPNASKSAVLVGDSVALTYLTSLRGLAEESKDWKLTSYAAFGCAFVDADVTNANPEVTAGCPAKKAEAIDAIRSIKPDVVFVTNTYEAHGELTASQWRESMITLIASFRSFTPQVILLAPPPSDVNIASCYTKASRPASCISSLTTQWTLMAKVERGVAQRTNSRWFDPTPLFCDSRGLCPSFVGDVPVKKDRVHMTPDYAKRITPALSEQLRANKLADLR